MSSPLLKKLVTIICVVTLGSGLTACGMNPIEKIEAEKREAERIEAEKRDAEEIEAEKRAAEKREAEKRAAEKREADKAFDEVTLYKDANEGVAVIGGPFRYHPDTNKLSARYADITFDCTDFDAASEELDKLITEYESDTKFNETETLPGPKGESSYQQRFTWVNVPESKLDNFLNDIRKSETLEINDIYDQYFDEVIAKNINDVRWKAVNELYRKTEDAESKIKDETNQTLLKNQSEFLKNFKEKFYDDTTDEYQIGYASVNISLRGPVQYHN